MSSDATTDGVAEALRSLLVERYGAPIELAGPATANATGFDSAIHYVRYRGASLPEPWRGELVIRVKSRVDAIDDARFEAAVHGWLGSHGYPAPAILEVFDAGELTPHPAQVIERAPGVMAFEAVKRAPWRLRGEVARLAALQVQLHELDPTGFPDSVDLVERRLSLPRRVAGLVDDAELDAAIADAESLLPALRDAPASVCHGDFHPLNVIVGDGGAMVIDWTDAGVGDRHGDLARTLLLFELAKVAAGGRAERGALGVVGPRLRRSYERRYRELLPVDDDRIALWTPVHLLHAWAQAIGADLDIFGVGADLTDRLPPKLLEELRDRYRTAIGAVRRRRPST